MRPRAVISTLPTSSMLTSTRSLAAVALCAIALAGCGSGDTVPPGSAAASVEVVGQGAVMKQSPTSDIELCIGAMLTSYPPQCGGPKLLGEFSWDDVESEQASGVRWTNQWYYAVGYYDAEADTFTLTRPLSSEPPEGYVERQVEEPEFPQLCDDPYEGGDPDFSDDLVAQELLQQELESLDGYIGSWVSDGHNEFNVLVTGDPEAVRAELREIWPGGLCVERRDGATYRDIASAQDALSDHFQELGITGTGGGPGELNVEVIIADPVTVERIHEIVSDWLRPEQVRVTGVFRPLSS